MRKKVDDGRIKDLRSLIQELAELKAKAESEK